MDHASAVMTFVLETLKWPKVSWTPTRFGGGSRTLLWGGLPWIEGGESEKKCTKRMVKNFGFWCMWYKMWCYMNGCGSKMIKENKSLIAWINVWCGPKSVVPQVSQKRGYFSSRDCGQGSRPNGAVNGLIYDEVNGVWAVSMKKCSL